MDDRSFVAAQAFILEAKKYWTGNIFPALKEEYLEHVAVAEKEPETAGEAGALLVNSFLYHTYSWMERHLQRFKYVGRYGLAPYHEERCDTLVGEVMAMANPEQYEILSGFEMPKYYEAIDIHQHPGGVWRDDFAAHVYERGARTTTPMMGTRHRDLHQRFTDLIAEGGVPTSMLDMGCGFGKSTIPFCESFPDSRIEAVDLSAPCILYGAAMAAKAQAGNVCFRQMTAFETDYGDEEFDLVTSTMLIHELPPREIGRLWDEAWRLTAPGGRIVHLDFYHLPDAFTRFIHYGHGRRNNEPFMEPWAEMDVKSDLIRRGFKNVEVAPFAEVDGIDPDNHSAWRFPWTIISAEK